MQKTTRVQEKNERNNTQVRLRGFVAIKGERNEGNTQRESRVKERFYFVVFKDKEK